MRQIDPKTILSPLRKDHTTFPQLREKKMVNIRKYSSEEGNHFSEPLRNTDSTRPEIITNAFQDLLELAIPFALKKHVGTALIYPLLERRGCCPNRRAVTVNCIWLFLCTFLLWRLQKNWKP